MKFLFVAPRFHTNLYYRVLSLQSKGHEVRVLVLYRGKSEYYKDVTFQEIPLSNLSKILIFFVRKFKKSGLKSHYEIILQSPNGKLKKEIKNFAPDIIFLKEFKNFLAFKTIWAGWRTKSEIFVFAQSRTTTIKGSQNLFRILLRLFKRFNVRAFITPVWQTYQAFSSVKILPVFYVPFVFPIQDIGNRPFPIEKDKLKIISIGKYVKRKDQLLLIKAIERLRKKGYNIEVNFFGEIAEPAYYENLKDYLHTHRLLNSIHLNTNVPYTEIKKEYLRHDVFVLPSYKEPAAYSPVEAMAYGLPVICSSECGTNCYIKEGVNGFIFKAHDRSDLEKTLEQIAANPENLKMLSRNVLRLFKINHNVDVFSNKIEKIIKNI